MKIKKSLYLTLALVLPISIFLFLKFFGKNQFDVEPLFQEKVDVNSDCNGEYTFPYVIPDSVARSFQVETMNPSMLVIFLQDSPTEIIRKQRNRIAEEFANDHVVIESIDGKNINFSFLRNCIFLMPEQSNVVLVDKEKRIRGQYDASSLDDMDRLIVEMKIILKRY